MSKSNVKPISHRQIRALTLWLAGGCKSKARAIREAGYGKSIARKPHKVFDSPAVLEELNKLGLNAQGVRLPPEVIDLTEYQLPEPIKIDFDNIPKEKWQELKEKLEAVDGVPLRFSDPRRQEESKPYTPPGRIVYTLSIRGDNDSLSSM